jgi:hypothetical protein
MDQTNPIFDGISNQATSQGLDNSNPTNSSIEKPRKTPQHGHNGPGGIRKSVKNASPPVESVSSQPARTNLIGLVNTASSEIDLQSGLGNTDTRDNPQQMKSLQVLSKIYRDLCRVSSASKSANRRLAETDLDEIHAMIGKSPTFSQHSSSQILIKTERARLVADPRGYREASKTTHLKAHLEHAKHNMYERLTHLPDLPTEKSAGFEDQIHEEYLKRSRVFTFACRHGWMLLAILVFSQSFRAAYFDSDEDLWEAMNVAIQDNSRSLAMFAQLRGINGQSLLAYHKCHELTDREIRAPFLLAPGHPHLTALSRTGIPQPIKINGCLVESIDECLWLKGLVRMTEPSHILSLPWPEDPSKISSRDATAICTGCRSTCRMSVDSSCTCTLRSSIREALVEITEDSKFGRGVRTLEKIKKGRYLGEYTGIIHSFRYPGDRVYSAIMLVCDPRTDEERYKYVVSACYRGNWTRFINHSCDSLLIFEAVIIGEKHRIMIRARRNIEAFEILTIDYGHTYFKPGECECGAGNCRFKRLAPESGSNPSVQIMQSSNR